MYIFFNNFKNIQVKRQTRNAQGLSSFGNISIIRGHFRPLNESESAINNIQMSKGFMLMTDLASNIQTGDKIEIEGKEYNVQAMTEIKRAIGTLRYKRCILTYNA